MAKVVCFYFKTISKKHATHMMHTVAILKIVLAFFRETFRSDYEALRERMTTLPDKTTHDVMVTGFHTKITSMLHMFLKKLTIQAHSIIL